ncbi:deoxycytidine triphosphate deaminase [hydrocarbon metagenome]|uniref:Deoxycytidine triphosphate deaminase n=1 Tax=hydrocarbon metagenome TaxID=938273 RepID=A0A0W8FFU9_9ZZZZ
MLQRGACTLVPSIERVELPADIAGTLRCRSSYARRGVLLGGGFVDPGFRGQLTLCLTNCGPKNIPLCRGDRVVQMILYCVQNGDRLYSGKYLDSRGVVEG